MVRENLDDSPRGQENSDHKTVSSPFDQTPKRTFTSLRHLILIGLVKGPQTINQISLNSGINWRTVENHLTYLIGREYVKIFHRTTYLKIYELTEKGKSYLTFLKERYQEAHIKNLDTDYIEHMSVIEKEFITLNGGEFK